MGTRIRRVGRVWPAVLVAAGLLVAVVAPAAAPAPGPRAAQAVAPAAAPGAAPAAAPVVYTANPSDGSVSRVDTSATPPARTDTPVGSGPRGVAVSPDGRYVYTAN